MSKIVFAPASSISSPQTLIQSIRLNAANNAAAPAIVAPNRSSLTFGALLRQIEQFGSELRRVGIGARSRVAVAIPDGPELAVTIVAICCHTAVIPIDPKLTAAEIEDLFSACQIDALVTVDDTSPTAREVAIRHGALLLTTSRCDDDGELMLRALSGSRTAETISAQPHDPALILRTSGTTGRPKLVVVTHANLLSMAARLQGWFNLGPSDRVLSVMPLHYAQGLKIALFSPLILGGSIAIPSRSPGFNFFHWLKELKPTWYSAGPTFHHRVIDAGRELQGSKISHSLRFINSAAAPLADSRRAELERLFGVPILDSYGLSEAGLVAANSVNLEGRRPGTVGKFCDGELAIKTDDGSIVDKGGLGEIVVRGAGLSPGYLDGSMICCGGSGDGWFNTGDLGRIDADGFLTICGRIKEVIVRGGEKVSPAEIDAALLQHPAVAEAAAFAVPHPRLGEDVAAAVVMQPGASVAPQELRRFLQKTLSFFKLPRRIHFVDSLPKGPTGKIQRESLSQNFGTASKKGSDTPLRTMLEIEIAEIWQKLLNREDIGPNDDFFELGGDSLLATQMLFELEHLTELSLPETLLFDNATIRELTKSLVPRRRYDDQNLLLQLQQGTGGKPFIFVDGDFRGGGYYVRQLANSLGPEWPFFTLRSHGMLGGSIPSIEEMADHYRQLLDVAGITGSVRIGGHCNGALVAFELARQLEAAGRDVEMVAMIESISLNARPAVRHSYRAFEAILNLFGYDTNNRQMIMNAIMSRLWRYVEAANRQFEPRRPLWQSFPWWAARRIAKLFSKPRYTSKTDDTSNGRENGTYSETDDDKIRVIFGDRMSAYIPKPIRAELFIVVSESSSEDPKFNDQVWRNLTSRSESAIVPGNHLSCVSTTSHVAALTKELRKRLVALDGIKGLSNSDNYSQLHSVRTGPFLSVASGGQPANNVDATARSDHAQRSMKGHLRRAHWRP